MYKLVFLRLAQKEVTLVACYISSFVQLPKVVLVSCFVLAVSL